MKIVSDETVMNIDFVETILTSEKSSDELFSVNVDLQAATFYGKGNDIWLSLMEFEQFIARLKIIDIYGTKQVMLQTAIEAGEYYAKNGDHLTIHFTNPIDEYFPCTVTLGAHPRDWQIKTYPRSQTLIHSFGLDNSTFSNLISDFEGLKTVIVEDLERRAKEENFFD
jgi:hypothetical protein